MAHSHSWWQTGVIYQIYPRSFLDGNGDGVGDLPGITSKLDYLQWLGMDALWLSPMYPSPMADFGYDISDYTDVHPLFGTLHDFDILLEESHRRNLKVILDFVPNHTSDEHPWFQLSRSNRTNEKRDWYIWRDPAPDGGPPNNWLSNFGGSAWQLDEQTGQYYLHIFDVKQVDLNWRNPAVRQAMYDVLRFWFDRGVDGFRIDVLSRLLKDEQFRDNPVNPDWKMGDPLMYRQNSIYTQDLPEIHEIIREMRVVADQYDERVLIGEIYLPVESIVKYYGEQLDEIQLPFNFQLVTTLTWDANTIRRLVDTYEAALPVDAWPNWVLGNHDKPRIASRVGREQARTAQMLLLTLRGTPTCYYGEELAMMNVPIPQELMHDPPGKVNPAYSRDPERTPMQWDSSDNAGFCAPSVTPWLPVADDYQIYNVAVEQRYPHSMLMLTKRLLELRRALPALTLGSYQPVELENVHCFAYLRQDNEQRFLVILNFSPQDQVVAVAGGVEGTIVLSTFMDREDLIDLSDVRLRGNEGMIINVGEL